MPTTHYIACNNVQTYTDSVSQVHACRVPDGAEVFTLQQMQNEFGTASLSLTVEQAWLFSGGLYAAAMMAYGFKLIASKLVARF